MNRKFVMKFIVMAIAAVSAVSAQTTTTTTTTRNVNLLPIGLAPTETVQVNLLNLATASSNGTAASCTGSVSFINSAGTVIGAATPFTIASEALSSVALPFAKASTGTTRILVRPQIALTTTSNTPCSLTYTLETYDTTTGVTHIYNTGGSIATPIAQGGFGGR